MEGIILTCVTEDPQVLTLKIKHSQKLQCIFLYFDMGHIYWRYAFKLLSYCSYLLQNAANSKGSGTITVGGTSIVRTFFTGVTNAC